MALSVSITSSDKKCFQNCKFRPEGTNLRKGTSPRAAGLSGRTPAPGCAPPPRGWAPDSRSATRPQPDNICVMNRTLVVFSKEIFRREMAPSPHLAVEVVGGAYDGGERGQRQLHPRPPPRLHRRPARLALHHQPAQTSPRQTAAPLEWAPPPTASASGAHRASPGSSRRHSACSGPQAARSPVRHSHQPQRSAPAHPAGTSSSSSTCSTHCVLLERAPPTHTVGRPAPAPAGLTARPPAARAGTAPAAGRRRRAARCATATSPSAAPPRTPPAPAPPAPPAALTSSTSCAP
ncbi:hypothetical protein ACJJTC_013052 [Scirpophaga incertulas]